MRISDWSSDVCSSDLHIEVIVRQMLQKVEITDGGDTTLLPAEQLDYLEMMEYNAKLPKNGKPAVGRPVLLGITKASLQTRSFISAARSEERRVGKECVSTCRSWWSPEL